LDLEKKNDNKKVNIGREKKSKKPKTVFKKKYGVISVFGRLKSYCAEWEIRRAVGYCAAKIVQEGRGVCAYTQIAYS
jgi:hypothetical protein